jgi:hypothetical protein
MKLIHHIYANATFSREDFYKQSRLKIASIKRIFRIFKQQRGLMNRATRKLGSARQVRQGAGGANRDRTGDLLLAKQALSQLSYGPGSGWWVWEELHPRPHPYQGCALTN